MAETTVGTTQGSTRFAGYLLVASIPLFMAQAAVATIFGFVEALLGVPLQVVFIWIGLALFVFSQQGIRWMLGGQGRLPIVFGLLVVLAVLLRYGTDLDFIAFRKLMQIITGVAVYIVTFHAIRDERVKRWVVRSLFAMTMASAGLALMELTIGFRVPWSGYSGLAHGVPVGFEYSPIPFSYALVVPTTAAIVALFSISGSSTEQKFIVPGWLTWGTAVTGFVALVATASRSGTAGVALGSAFGIVMLGRERNNMRAAAAILFAMIGLVALVLSSGVLEYVWKGGVTGDSRLGATWIAYSPIILSNPLGTPDDVDLLGALRDAERIFGFGIDRTTAVLGFQQAPHHFLLTAGLSYGWIAIIALVAIYYHAFRLARRAIRLLPQGDPNRLLIIAFLAGTLALLAHSCFHNASILLGEMRNWISLAILNSLSIATLIEHRQKGVEPPTREGLNQPAL